MVETSGQYLNLIKSISYSVKNELELRKMRDNISEGILKTGTRQYEVEIRQVTLEKDFVKVQQDASSVIPSGAEIVVSRGGYTTLGSRLTEEENKVTAQLQQKANKSDIGTPLSATSVSEMIDTKRVYVNTSDGNWYSYDGGNWSIGGKYNSEAVAFDSISLPYFSTEIQQDISKEKNVPVVFENNTFWNSQTDTATKENFTGFYRTTTINVTGGEKFKISLKAGSSSKQRSLVVTDELNKIVWKSSAVDKETVLTNYELIIPNKGKKLLITDYNNDSVFSAEKMAYDKIATKTYVREMVSILGKNFQGKNISILGDSISAFKDHIPAGNRVYYTGENSGVSKVDQMWWNIVADRLEMNVLQVEAWSGSKVSAINKVGENFTPMSDSSRCQNLHKGAVNPDVIIILAGTNDYSKTQALVGDYPQSGAQPTLQTTFSESYALMLERIQERYPDSIIYCCSLPVFVRTNTDKKSIEWNDEGKTVSDYNNVIRDLCEMFPSNYIDLNGCGITRQNAYPTYCEDYSNTPTHPNALGHLKYAEQIVKQM